MKFCFEWDWKKILFHLCFLIPLYWGYVFYSLALLGLIILFYVKVFKINDIIKYNNLDAKEIRRYEKIRDRWKYLTFLE